MQKIHTLKILAGYILFIFVLQLAAAFMPYKAASIYLSFAIIIMGLAAVIAQKLFHKQRFMDMGFRINRNALAGVGVGIIYVGLVLVLHYWLAQRIGLIGFKENPEFFQSEKINYTAPIQLAFGVGALGAVPLFISCLFGEELVFRGYILSKLRDIAGPLKAVMLCVIIFAVWHIPAYFSIYAGGALKEGFLPLLIMLASHAISAIPLCVLYLKTGELYGVSLIHAILDVFQYVIIGNPSMGEISRSAMYNVIVFNSKGLELFSWTMSIISVFIMLVLVYSVCKFIGITDPKLASNS